MRSAWGGGRLFCGRLSRIAPLPAEFPRWHRLLDLPQLIAPPFRVVFRAGESLPLLWRLLQFELFVMPREARLNLQERHVPTVDGHDAYPPRVMVRLGAIERYILLEGTPSQALL